MQQLARVLANALARAIALALSPFFDACSLPARERKHDVRQVHLAAAEYAIRAASHTAQFRTGPDDLHHTNILTCDLLVTYSRGVDEVFKALADPTRRSLLDELFREDGQTLGALEERFSMTRFGVMKHLKVLEEAGLVVTRRRGREKLHFLNPVPIRLVHDRWVSKYSEPWVAGLSEIKERLESQMEKVYEIFIKTTPEQLWKAITDPEIRAKYNFGAAVNSDWTVGSEISVDVAAQGLH